MTGTTQRPVADAIFTRPRIYDVAPMSFWIAIIYIVTDMFVGVTLFIAFDSTRVTAPLLIVNDIMTFKFWGTIFISLSILQAFALLANKWELTRRFLLAGVAVKAAWAIALLVRAATSSGTLLIAIPWIALAAIQIITIVFFIPLLYKSTNRVAEEHDQ